MPSLFWSGVGVKVAVVLKYVFPSVPVNELKAEMAERLPPETVISELVKETPGSSEKVNVMVAVSSALRVDTLLVIVSSGRLVSKLRLVLLSEVFQFPAESKYVGVPIQHHHQSVLVSSTGVKVAE